MPRRTTDTPLLCSFCGKGEAEAGKVVQGPGRIGICAECVHLCWEIVSDEPPGPSRFQESTLVLADESRHVVAVGLREAVSMLGIDDARIVAFDLVEGGRLAVRREAVRYVQAESEPEPGEKDRPGWADQA